MGIGVKDVIMIAVSLMVIALILPIGLGLLAIAGETILVPFNATGLDEAAITLVDVLDPSVVMMLTVLIPILAVIGIAVAFITFRD